MISNLGVRTKVCQSSRIAVSIVLECEVRQGLENLNLWLLCVDRGLVWFIFVLGIVIF